MESETDGSAMDLAIAHLRNFDRAAWAIIGHILKLDDEQRKAMPDLPGLVDLFDAVKGVESFLKDWPGEDGRARERGAVALESWMDATGDRPHITIDGNSRTWGVPDNQDLQFDSPDEQLHASFTPNNGIRIQVSNDDLEGMAVFDLEAVQAVLLAEALLRWAKVEVEEAIRLAATANVSLVLSSSQGWVPWSGGECPVADGVLVDALLDNGHILAQRRAGSLFWEAGKVFGQQIVAYRLPAK